MLPALIASKISAIGSKQAVRIGDFRKAAIYYPSGGEGLSIFGHVPHGCRLTPGTGLKPCRPPGRLGEIGDLVPVARKFTGSTGPPVLFSGQGIGQEDDPAASTASPDRMSLPPESH